MSLPNGRVTAGNVRVDITASMLGYSQLARQADDSWTVIYRLSGDSNRRWVIVFDHRQEVLEVTQRLSREFAEKLTSDDPGERQVAEQVLLPSFRLFEYPAFLSPTDMLPAVNKRAHCVIRHTDRGPAISLFDVKSSVLSGVLSTSVAHGYVAKIGTPPQTMFLWEQNGIVVVTTDLCRLAYRQWRDGQFEFHFLDKEHRVLSPHAALNMPAFIACQNEWIRPFYEKGEIPKVPTEFLA
jgi:hypothetical protein